MNIDPAENRDLTDRDINQPKESQPHTQHAGHGVLLGTDFRHAVEFSRSGRARPRPIPWPSFAAVSPLYTGLRNSRTSGVRPAVSRASRPGPFSLGAEGTIHGSGGPCTGGSQPSPPPREARSSTSATRGSTQPGGVVIPRPVVAR